MKRHTTPNCFDCRIPMVAGFVPDRMFHEDAVDRMVWQEGETEQAYELGVVPMGVKFDRKRALPVTTYRCPDCGLLQSYAVPRPS